MNEKPQRDRWTVIGFAVLAAVPLVWILSTGTLGEPSAWLGAVFVFAVGAWIFRRALATSRRAGEGDPPRGRPPGRRYR